MKIKCFSDIHQHLPSSHGRSTREKGRDHRHFLYSHQQAGIAIFADSSKVMASLLGAEERLIVEVGVLWLF